MSGNFPWLIVTQVVKGRLGVSPPRHRSPAAPANSGTESLAVCVWIVHQKNYSTL